MNAADVLKAALGHMEDRAATYDKPEGERSMPATVAAFNAVTGLSLTPEQGWLFCVLLKAVRSQQGGYRADNYEDGSAYFALMGEQAASDRKEPQCLVNDVGEVLLPPGFIAYKKGDAMPGPGTILRTVTKQGCIAEPREIGYFRWAGVVGYEVVKPEDRFSIGRKWIFASPSGPYFTNGRVYEIVDARPNHLFLIDDQQDRHGWTETTLAEKFVFQS